MEDKIVAYIGLNPGCTTMKIVTGLGLEVEEAVEILKRLARENTIVRKLSPRLNRHWLLEEE